VLDIVCPKCSTLHHAGEEHVGRLLRCAGCGDTIPVTRTPSSVSKATPSVIDTVGEVSSSSNHTRAWRQKGTTRRTKLAWLGGAIVVLVLAAITGIAYHRQQKYAEQLDKQVQNEIAQKNAQTSLQPSDVEVQKTDTTTSPETSQLDNKGQTFRIIKKNQAPSSSQQLAYPPSQVATFRSPTLRMHQSTGTAQQPDRDPGIDTAEPVPPSIDLRAEPNQEAALIRTATHHSLLALIHRAPKDGWYDVVDVHSGDEGWVRESDVRIHRTEHPQPETKFSEQYVGGNSAPEVTVDNQTSSTLTLKIGDASPQKLQPGEHQMPIPEGTLDFYATVPNAIPAQGRENFKRGYRYSWKFWIEMHSNRIP